MVNNYQPISAMLKSIIDYRGKTPPKSEFGIPCISAANVKNGRIDMSSPSYVSQETYNRWTTRGFPQPGDIIITTEAPVGAVAIFPGDQTYLLTRRVMALQTNSDLLNNRFLFYILQTPEIKNQLYAVARGTTVQRVLKTDITGLTIPLPPLSEQKKIVHILGALDDKIELNQEMNTTLEGMAQALFKSWFVDFDPVIDNALAAGNPIPEAFAARAETRRKALADGTANRDVAKQFPAAFQFTEEMGWIPAGWEVKKAEAIVNRKKVNQKFTKKNVLTIGEIPVFDQGAGLLLGYHNGLPDIESSQKNPSFIFGDHTCITHLSTKPFSVGPNVIPLEAKNYNSYWTYFAIKDIQNFQEYRRHWMEFKIKNVLVPLKNLASFFGDFIQNSYISIESKTDESVVLTNLRDTLLPKLISGEISIPEAKKLTEEALA